MNKLCSDSMDITVVHTEPTQAVTGEKAFNVYARGFDNNLYKYNDVLYKHNVNERIGTLMEQSIIWLDYWTQVEDKFNDRY